MRCIQRFKTPFYYCNYAGEEAISDGSYNTGETRVVYSDPILAKGHISPAKGSTSVEQFGNSLQYDRVIVLDDPAFPIDEQTVLFVEREPSFDGEGTPQFDYIVKKVARSFNYVAIAISKVEVS